MTEHIYLTLTVNRVNADIPGRLGLSLPEARALALLVKRFGFSDCRYLTDDSFETDLILDGLAKLKLVLADANIHSR
jgi:hypothetical protein